MSKHAKSRKTAKAEEAARVAEITKEFDAEDARLKARIFADDRALTFYNDRLVPTDKLVGNPEDGYTLRGETSHQKSSKTARKEEKKSKRGRK